MIRRNWLKRAIRILLRTSLAGFIAFLTILLVRAFDTRGLPDLQVWHKVKLSNEFDRREYGREIRFEQYRDIEDKLFTELDKKVFF